MRQSSNGIDRKRLFEPFQIKIYGKTTKWIRINADELFRIKAALGVIKRHVTQSKSPGRKIRIVAIVNRFLKMDPDRIGERLSQDDLMKVLNTYRQKIWQDLKPFIDHKLVVSSRGYRPTELLFKVVYYTTIPNIGDRYSNLFNTKGESQNENQSFPDHHGSACR